MQDYAQTATRSNMLLARSGRGRMTLALQTPQWQGRASQPAQPRQYVVVGLLGVPRLAGLAGAGAGAACTMPPEPFPVRVVNQCSVPALRVAGGMGDMALLQSHPPTIHRLASSCPGLPRGQRKGQKGNGRRTPTEPPRSCPRLAAHTQELLIDPNLLFLVSGDAAGTSVKPVGGGLGGGRRKGSLVGKLVV